MGHSASKSTDPNGTTPALIQNVLEGTGTNLVSSVNPSALGQSVTFTATVTASAGGGVTPDGTVTFFNGATILGNVALNGSAVATFTTAALTAGAHAITATYGGDATNDIQGSTSAILSQDVQTASSAALVSSQNPSTYGSAVTFTATITAGGAVAATGTVKFLDSGVQIGTGTLAGSPATAGFTTSALNVATHAITVSYAGDAYNSASNSGPLSQVVNQAQTGTTVGASPSPGSRRAAGCDHGNGEADCGHVRSHGDGDLYERDNSAGQRGAGRGGNGDHQPDTGAGTVLDRRRVRGRCERRGQHIDGIGADGCAGRNANIGCRGAESVDLWDHRDLYSQGYGEWWNSDWQRYLQCQRNGLWRAGNSRCNRDSHARLLRACAGQLHDHRGL